MSNDKQINFDINSFIIFDPSLSYCEEEEHKKILYCYPQSVDIEQRMKIVGLCEAMNNFATEFTDVPCQFIHTLKTRIVILTLEKSMTIVMTVNIPKKSGSSEEYLEEKIQNSICSVILQHCRQMLFLFLGPPSFIIKRDGLKTFIDNMKIFFDENIGQGILEGYQITDGLPGVQLLPSDKGMYVESQNVIYRLECKFTDIIGSILLFNNNLVYSTLEKDDLWILYRYLTTSLLAKHNLNESLDHSFTLGNMGKFVNLSVKSIEKDNISKSKTVFLDINKYLSKSIPDPKEATFFVYKALQATVIIFVRRESCPTNCELETIHKYLGEELTRLANSLSQKSEQLNSETPYKYMYWNPQTLSVKCTLFPIRQWRSEFPALVSGEIMRVMSDVKQEIDRDESINNRSIKEMDVKLQSDSWVVYIENIGRQLYVAINKRNLSLVDVSKEMRHLCSRDFPNVFKVEID